MPVDGSAAPADPYPAGAHRSPAACGARIALRLRCRTAWSSRATRGDRAARWLGKSPRQPLGASSESDGQASRTGKWVMRTGRWLMRARWVMRARWLVRVTRLVAERGLCR
ncbi:hypothetical protein GCM10020218_075760 [Dactylosporangium vinaceum]